MEEGGSVLDKYRISYADITIGSVIGEGSFGTVHEGELVRGSGASARGAMEADWDSICQASLSEAHCVGHPPGYHTLSFGIPT